MKHFSSNGAITYFIRKLAKKEKDPSVVKAEAKKALRSFPLSSYKLVYNEDLEEMSPEIRKAVLEACIETDNEKLEKVRRIEAELGIRSYSPSEPFGRSNI